MSVTDSDLDNPEALQRTLLEQVHQADSLEALEAVRVDALGRKGRLTTLMKSLGSLPPDQRKEAGQRLNAVKEAVQQAIEDRKAALEAAALDKRLAEETVDVTLPARPERAGRIHPISQTIEELIALFGDMGFAVAEGPDIEDAWHNFTALNIPAHHPSRQMMDTFYLPARPGDGEEMVLRTHTSNAQIRTMERQAPPIRVMLPGRTYRSDYDQTHTPMFHQVEALVIEEGIHMGHLKGCLYDLLSAFFAAPDLKLRFRPSYFPFTEPSMEVDVGCSWTGGELKIGGETQDWLEILGSGMVNPRVLAACGLDPERHQGYAFGMGIERIAMLKYGIPDLRTFFEADTRWLKHYGFRVLDVPNVAQGVGA